MTLRVSAAEVLAVAVLELFPNVQLVKGDVFEWGFFYDFVFPHPFSEQHLSLIEEHMRAIAKEKRGIDSIEMVRDNAIRYFQDHGQPIKAEILSAVSDNVVELFRIGKFVDLCPSPYVGTTKEVEVFRLHKFTEKMVPLSSREVKVVRIVGSVYHDKASLKQSIKANELARKRDHRKLGKELHLFGVQDDAGPGLWFWYPRGALIREQLLGWWKEEHRRQRYLPLCTPSVVKKTLLQEAGYYDSFDEEKERRVPLSFQLEDGEYLVAPLRTPYYALAFRSILRSYRELPVRYAECAEVFFSKKNDQLRGMFKARSLCVDEAICFCTEKQVREELVSSLQFISKTIKIFGFEYRCILSARGRRYAGTVGQWKTYERLIDEVMTSYGYEYSVDDHDTVFHGPTIRVRLKDALGREWDGPSVCIDFTYTQRLGLRYQGADGDMHTPMMIRRSLFGSLERFIALLVEHYAGMFPLWLAPEQVRVLPVSEKNEEYAEKVRQELERSDLRVGIDCRQDKLAARMRIAQCEKVPYVVVVGDDEEKKKMVAVRLLHSADTWKLKVDAFREKLLEEVATKKICIRDPGE